MREIGGTARNIMLSKTEGGFVPVAELILVLTEPEYTLDFAPGKPHTMSQKRKTETVRINVVREGMEMLITELISIKNELDDLEKSLPKEGPLPGGTDDKT